MTMRHRGEGTTLWYRVFRYRWLERQVAARPDVRRILDLGCGSGENSWRFAEWGCWPVGLDVAHTRLVRARAYGPAVQGEGTRLPFYDGAFDMVYATHVLHHVAAYRALLAEAWRCLRPDGTLLLVETVEDHPLVRLGRDLHPRWSGDAVQTRLTFRDLLAAVREAGFDVLEAGQYSVLFWAWEVLPERFPWLDVLTPLWTALEVPLQRIARHRAAHGYYLAQKRGER